jgi:hypothetical protein
VTANVFSGILIEQLQFSEEFIVESLFHLLRRILKLATNVIYHSSQEDKIIFG